MKPVRWKKLHWMKPRVGGAELIRAGQEFNCETPNYYSNQQLISLNWGCFITFTIQGTRMKSLSVFFSQPSLRQFYITTSLKIWYTCLEEHIVLRRPFIFSVCFRVQNVFFRLNEPTHLWGSLWPRVKRVSNTNLFLNFDNRNKNCPNFAFLT